MRSLLPVLTLLATLDLSGSLASQARDLQVNLGASSSRVVSPRIAHAYVVWVDARNGRKDIYFNRSFDMGATWQTADVRIDTDTPGAADSDKVRLAVTGNDIHVVWEDMRNGRRDIYWNRSSDGGTTWLKSDIRIDTDVAGAADSVDPQRDLGGSPERTL